MNRSPIFKHAVECFEHGLEHFLDASEKSRKFALLHIDQAIELFLKEKIVQLGKSIYKNDGTTLNLHESFNSLKDLRIPERPRLEELHDLRNTIQHKGLTPDAASTQFYVEVAYNFVKRFLVEELSTPLDQILTRLHRALMEGEHDLPEPIEGAREVLVILDTVRQVSNPSERIISAYTALSRAYTLLNRVHPEVGTVRGTIRGAATARGFTKQEVDSHLDRVFRLRGDVVHSAYVATEDDAKEYLASVVVLLRMIGCLPNN